MEQAKGAEGAVEAGRWWKPRAAEVHRPIGPDSHVIRINVEPDSGCSRGVDEVTQRRRDDGELCEPNGPVAARDVFLGPGNPEDKVVVGDIRPAFSLGEK